MRFFVDRLREIRVADEMLEREQLAREIDRGAARFFIHRGTRPRKRRFPDADNAIYRFRPRAKRYGLKINVCCVAPGKNGDGSPRAQASWPAR